MPKLDIIFENKELLVVNKPAKLLTISDGKTKHTLYSMAREYVKKQHKSNKIFIVHRLDKDTSGLVVFAKNEKLKLYLQENWSKIAVREYLAIIEGHLAKKKETITQYLAETKTHQVYVTKNKNFGKLAQTSYEVLKENSNYTLVLVNILTGRKNQIRACFSSLNTPIVGDKKYGAKTNPLKRLALHAYHLKIVLKDETLDLKCDPPKEFLKFLQK